MTDITNEATVEAVNDILANLQQAVTEGLLTQQAAANAVVYSTKAAMLLAPVVNDQWAVVINDPVTDNNGYYVGVSGVWTYSALQPAGSQQLASKVSDFEPIKYSIFSGRPAIPSSATHAIAGVDGVVFQDFDATGAARFVGMSGQAGNFTAAEITAMDAKAVAESAQTQSASLGFLLASPDRNFNLVLRGGQSIQAGAQSYPPLTLSPVAAGVLMIGRSERPDGQADDHFVPTGAAVAGDDMTFRPLVATVRKYPADQGTPVMTPAEIAALGYANALLGESPAITSAYEFRALRNALQGRDSDYALQQLVVANAAVGSSGIQKWVYGGDGVNNYFNRALEAATVAKSIAGASSIGLALWSYWQGTNNSGTMSVSSYLSYLRQIRADVTLHIEKALFGQSRPAPMMVYAERINDCGFRPTASTYAAGTTYDAAAVVEASLALWLSLASANTGNTPSSSPIWWARLRARHEWQSGTEYAQHDWVTLANGTAWRSTVAANVSEPGVSGTWLALAGTWSGAGLDVHDATLEFAKTEPTAVGVCVGYYPVDRGVHFNVNGSRWLGAYEAKVAHHVLTRGQAWQPTHIKSAVFRGKEVLLTYHVPAPPLRFAAAWDQDTEVMLKNKGLRVFDAQSPLPATPNFYLDPPPYHPSRGVQVVSVELVGAATVRITCARELTGPVEISYADPSGSFCLGNICDSDVSRPLARYTYTAGTNMSPDENIPSLVDKQYPMPNFAWPQRLTATLI